MDLQEALNAINERLGNLEKFCEMVATKFAEQNFSTRRTEKRLVSLEDLLNHRKGSEYEVSP